MTQENSTPDSIPSAPAEEPLKLGYGNPEPASIPVRTLKRIVAEAAFVAFIGALVFGISAEMHLLHIGFIIAVIIWVGGTPLLEVLRVMQTRR